MVEKKGKLIWLLKESNRGNLFIWGKDLIIPKVRTSPVNTGKWGWWDTTTEDERLGL